ncbi:MucB/RseB C-terminal domain-containing protein [Xylophilus sp. GOD-11R]|uniref:MucB/RseB C-terminal domain-containing protein n=1 Tax=Xylophilus sp. GOD-11R TaxID=3089814 RepID=UPI00298BEC8F|nr:MucB/RseB C-terminal domain-containing protein [Xylophilus sp. GOD-11R]WPB56000.1 MucB/RseB C-terminal domain-containing protein [Xylophilus sp. GOD-11R]
MSATLLRRLLRRLPTLCLLGLCTAAAAQTSSEPAAADVDGRSRTEPGNHGNQASITQVLQRAREAARKKTYTGTFVVLSANGAMASSRVWHLSEAGQQIERMESLTGTPRLVFRRNNQVTTYLPDTHTARLEQRDTVGLFPHLARVHAGVVGEFYLVKPGGTERVAGFDTDVFQLMPRDAARYGYRLWVERRSGFAVQLQTLDKHGHVLEQAAFSDLQFDVPLRADKMQQAMGNIGAYKLEKLERVRTSAEAEGWLARAAVPGFESLDCYKRAPGNVPGAVQWIFSDGLATVSLFIEPYGEKPRQEWRSMAGLTQMLGRRVAGDWWLTAMGEVPPQTLDAFAAILERRP